VVLVPWFEGERTPNLPDARASVSGLSLATTTRPHLARAAVEGMLCSLALGLEAIRDLGVEARRIRLIGGAARNVAVARIAAQVFDVPVTVPLPGEYVAMGAARQAVWALTATRPAWDVEVEASPAVDTRPEILAGYRAAAAKAASA
jgi:xylulokinase